MCEAVTGISYAAWALIAAAAGTGVAAKSAHDQSQYQGEVNKNNAKSAQFAAQDALDRGMVAEDLQRTKNQHSQSLALTRRPLLEVGRVSHVEAFEKLAGVKVERFL